MTMFDTPPLELMASGAPPLVSHEQQVREGVENRKRQEQRLGLVEQGVAALDQYWIKSFGLDELFGGGGFKEDPTFELTEQMVREYGQGLPQEDWQRLADAVSKPHLEHISQRLREIRTTRGMLEEAGWTGTALSIGADVLNPVTIGAMAFGGVGGGIGLASRAERVSALISRGLLYSGATAGELAYRQQYDPDIDSINVIQGALIGFGVGHLEGSWRMSRAWKRQAAVDLLAAKAEGLKLTPKGEAVIKSAQDEASASAKAMEREVLSNPDVAATLENIADPFGARSDVRGVVRTLEASDPETAGFIAGLSAYNQSTWGNILIGADHLSFDFARLASRPAKTFGSNMPSGIRFVDDAALGARLAPDGTVEVGIKFRDAAPDVRRAMLELEVIRPTATGIILDAYAQAAAKPNTRFPSLTGLLESKLGLSADDAEGLLAELRTISQKHRTPVTPTAVPKPTAALSDIAGTTTPRATSVVPEAVKPSIPSRVVDWADKAEEAIKARQAARAIPRGRDTGGTIIFDELIDGLELAVVKTVRAGAATAEAVRKTVADYIASHKDLTPEQRSALESRGKVLETELDDALKPDLPTGKEPPPGRPGDFDVSDLADADVPKAAMSKERFGISSYLGSDPSNEVRKFGAAMVHDPIQRGDGMPIRQSATRHLVQLLEETNAPYYRSVAKAFDSFAKERGAQWWHPFKRANLRREFNTAVTDVVEFGIEHADPSINRAAEAARTLIREAHDIAVRYGIPEFKAILADRKFVPHILNQYQTNKFVGRFGWDQTVKLVRASLVKFEGVDERILDNISKGWLNRAMQAVNRTEFDASAIFKAVDADSLAEALRKVGLDEIDIKDVLANIGADNVRPGTVSRAMNRTSFNMATVVPLVDRTTGEVVDVSIKSLFVRDIDALTHLYTRQLYGDATLQKVFKIFKSERPITTMEQLVAYLKDDMLKHGVPLDGLIGSMNVKDQEARIMGVLKSLKGIPDEGKWADVSRGLLDLGYIRSGGMFGIAQAGENIMLLQRVGLRAAFDTIPQIPAIIKSVANGTVDDELVREIASMGHGAGMLVRRHVHEIGGSVAEAHGAVSPMGRVVAQGRRFQSIASGLSPLTDIGEMMAAVGVSNRWINYAKQNRLPSKKRLAAMGLNEKQARAIIDEMRKPGVIEAIHGTGGKGRRLNLDSWDPQVRADFTNAVELFTRNAVQRTDIGQLALWMTTPLGRLAVQFRTFAVGAWEEQFLRNVQQRDAEMAIFFVAAAAIGALQAVAYAQVLSIGRDDREKFLKERLSPGNLALAAFNRTGWSSVTPIFADAVATFFGYKPAFSMFRPSGVEDTIFGNPTAAFLGDVATAGSALGAIVDPNRSVTRADFGRARQMIPFQNALGIGQGLTLFQNTLPKTTKTGSKL